MKLIFALLFVTGAVLGGYVLAHGELRLLFQPFEFLIIFGGAMGAMIAANPPVVLKGIVSQFPRILSGGSYSRQDYLDLLGLMYSLFTKARREGLMALEADIEEPHSSELFARFPSILGNHHALDFICDYMRMMVGGSMNSLELESLMDLELTTHHEEADQPGAAVRNMADALPAFGIVAAVLGVVITMSAISEPPEVLGHHIAAALVGTFLGILLSYGYVGPIGTALAHSLRQEAKYMECIKVCILATLNGYTPQVAVEFGRKVIYSGVRPSFIELDEYIRQNK
jgi:chemotaxis protein MotA